MMGRRVWTTSADCTGLAGYSFFRGEKGPAVTQSRDKIDDPTTDGKPTDRTPRTTAARKAASHAPKPAPWWRSGVLGATVLAVAFLAYALPPYATLNPAEARIHVHQNIWWDYPALVGHIAFGTIALTSVVFQMWTWLRVNHPKAHRVFGRVYVFGGVLPAGLLALLIVPFAGGPVGDGVEGVFWLGTTFYALVMARRGRWVQHRRWMMYSYALCAQIIWGRILLVTLTLAAPGYLQAHLGLMLETASWIGMMINLLIAQWWFEHTRRRKIQLPAHLTGRADQAALRLAS